jgi:iron-regulated transporter 1
MAWYVNNCQCLLYLSLSAGLSETLLAVMRAAAAGVGIAATVFVPMLVNELNLTQWGMVFLFMQTACLMIVVFSVKHSTVLVVAGIVMSRFGLWGFDLVATQIMQMLVSKNDVGCINGVQNALISVLYLISYLLPIIFSDPHQFIYVVRLRHSIRFCRSTKHMSFNALRML